MPLNSHVFTHFLVRILSLVLLTQITFTQSTSLILFGWMFLPCVPAYCVCEAVAFFSDLNYFFDRILNDL